MNQASHLRSAFAPGILAEQPLTPVAESGDAWRELTRCVDRLVELDALRPDVGSELQQKIVAQHFDLVVAGQFKRGKTSLINALIGAELLPVAVVPLTSVITVLGWGATATATILFENGERRGVALDELADYVTERGNPSNRKGVTQAHVTYPSRWLAGGIRLIDTPGVGSVYRNNTDVAQQFLPKADAVLFVLSVDQPLGAAECDFLASIRQYAERIFFLLNKADLLSDHELHESVEFTRGALRAAIDAEPAMFPISARLALKEHIAAPAATSVRSGMPQFARALEAFLVKDKTSVLAASVGRKLARAIAGARFAAEIELQSLSQSLEELERKAARFHEKKEEMLAARDDLDVLLGTDASRALQRPLEAALRAFKQELGLRVVDVVDRRYEDGRALGVRALHAALEAAAIAAVREGFDRWQRAQSDLVDKAFAAFCARHGERVDGIVEELYRFAADLFAVPYTTQRETTFRDIESRFYYKFWSEPPALRILAGALLPALPRAISERLVLRHVRRYALELVEMQSGRMRYDFSRRIDEALVSFRQAMGGRVDAAVAAIEAAIDKAIALRRSGEADARRQGATLRATLDELTQIEGTVTRFVDRMSAEGRSPRAPLAATITGKSSV
jgi:GTP-binding protein EngB required for normal cell division